MANTPMDFTAPMGSFEDWNLTRPVAIHMMRELVRAHIEDEGRHLGGFMAAACGLNIAVIADEGRPPEAMIAGILHNAGWLAIHLQTTALTDEQVVALRAITAATAAWM